ncbi:MAG: hypothetical protein GYA24_16745 [Candidatus Lokiarchaeota archaeon]|nr:hypothetical protein [Candidatus Lokiarchaeota archaeon]
MLRASEFLRHVLETSPYPVHVKQGFIMTDKGGRSFLIDGYSGDLHAQPLVLGKQVLDRIKAKQCPSCFYYASPEATFNCMHYVAEGYVHPVRICVVTEFHDGKMSKLVEANQRLGGVEYTPVQLKILAMLHAIHEGRMPDDVQAKIDAVPSQESLLGGSCPFYASTVDMKTRLITRNISRQQRKRHFLDVLKEMQYLSAGHHAVGASYFERRISELQAALARITSGSA